MTTDTMMTREDLADRLSGTATPSGVLIPWDTARELLEVWLEEASVVEELQRRGILDSAGRILPEGRTCH